MKKCPDCIHFNVCHFRFSEMNRLKEFNSVSLDEVEAIWQMANKCGDWQSRYFEKEEVHNVDVEV